MAAPHTINPYEQWLGLPADAERPDHYRLLGLRPFESDSQVISAAADKAMAKVRSFKPGAFARQWSELLDELRVAKAMLLDAEQRARYDVSLRDNGAAASGVDKPSLLSVNPATRADDDAGDVPAEFAPADPVAFAPPGKASADKPGSRAGASVHPAAQLLGLTGADAGPIFDEPEDDFTPARDNRRRNSPSAAKPEDDLEDPMAPVSFDERAAPQLPMASDEIPEAIYVEPSQPPPEATPLLCSPAMQILGAAALAPAVGMAKEESAAHAVTAEFIGDRTRPAALPPRRKSSSLRWFVVAGAGIAAVVLAVAGYFVIERELGGDKAVAIDNPPTDVDAGQTKKTPSGDKKPANTEIVAGEDIPLEPVADSPPDEVAAPGVASPDEMPAEPSPDTDIAEPPADDPATPAMEETEAPMATADPAQPATPLTAEESAVVAESLKAARAALAKNDAVAAQSEIAKAAPLARAEPQLASYEQLRELLEKSVEFWAAFDRGVASLTAGEELNFGSTKIMILEATSEQVRYEVAGLKRRSGVRDLPLGLAIAVAEKGMADPQSAESKVLKGAPLALQSNEAQAGQARTFWKDAEAQGADVKRLLAAVDDKYEFSVSASSGQAPSGEMSAELDTILASARKALGENDVERAVAALARGERLANDSSLPAEQQARLERLRLLADYLSQFWSIVGDALAGLEIGEEVLVNDMPVIVVEASRDELAVRSAGANHRFTRTQIPAGLALALANMRLRENDAATKMMAAALYAVQKDKSHQKTARRLWTEAAAAGADVGDLPKVLEDAP